MGRGWGGPSEPSSEWQEPEGRPGGRETGGEGQDMGGTSRCSWGGPSAPPPPSEGAYQSAACHPIHHRGGYGKAPVGSDPQGA